MSTEASDRDCFEYLDCPACRHIDVDFDLLEYRCVRCGICGATIHVTGYRVALGPPGDPTDHVGYLGVVA
jgi:ribosomal protein S27E